MSNEHTVVKIDQEAILMNKLSEPETMAQLITLLDNLEKFNVLFASIEQFIARSPEMANSLNRLVFSLREELQKDYWILNLQNSLETLKRLHKFINSDEFKQLEANLMNEKTLKLINSVSHSVTEASSKSYTVESERISIFHLIRDFTDPEIQPSIQFILNFAKILSKELKNA